MNSLFILQMTTRREPDVPPPFFSSFFLPSSSSFSFSKYYYTIDRQTRLDIVSLNYPLAWQTKRRKRTRRHCWADWKNILYLERTESQCSCSCRSKGLFHGTDLWNKNLLSYFFFFARSAEQRRWSSRHPTRVRERETFLLQATLHLMRRAFHQFLFNIVIIHCCSVQNDLHGNGLICWFNARNAMHAGTRLNEIRLGLWVNYIAVLSLSLFNR